MFPHRRTARSFAAVALALGLAMVALTGCGDSHDDSAATAPGSLVRAEDTSPGCAAGSDMGEAGDDAGSDGDGYATGLMHRGVPRRYFLALPRRSPERTGPAPVVIDLHSLNSDAATQDQITEMTGRATERGYVVITPDGLRRGMPVAGLASDARSWNSGVADQPPLEGDQDDVGFLAAVLEQVGEQQCIDRSRVFVTGLSNGAAMAARLACDRPDLVAGVGPVAGANIIDPCEPAAPPVPIVIIHGTGDVVVPYEGGELLGRPAGMPSVATTAAGWALRNGCDVDPVSEMLADDVENVRWEDCEAPTRLLLVIDGSHFWPGGTLAGSGPENSWILDRNTNSIHATELLLDEFDRLQGTAGDPP